MEKILKASENWKLYTERMRHITYKATCDSLPSDINTFRTVLEHYRNEDEDCTTENLKPYLDLIHSWHKWFYKCKW